MDTTVAEIEEEFTTLQNDVCTKLNRLLATNPKHSQLICDQACILTAATDSVTACHVVSSPLVEADLHNCDEDFIQTSKLFLTDGLFPSPVPGEPGEQLEGRTSNQLSSHEGCSTTRTRWATRRTSTAGIPPQLE